MILRRHGWALGLAGALCVWLVGCRSEPAAPQYSRPLPEGAFGLRRIADPARWPDLSPLAHQLSDPSFREALDRSLQWYAAPSSQQFFPSGPISHVHAWASAYALRELGGLDTATALSRLRSEFDVWESVGWDGSGTVFFTGYYTPVFQASRTRTPQYSYPLYRRPPDLVSDPVTGEVRGQRTPGGIVPYPTRAQIESRNLLNGLELVYLANRLDAYLIHVNGSAKLEMTDGSTMTIGYAGSNGRAYTSVGKLLVRDGKVDENRLSLPVLRDYFQQHPQELEGYIAQNDRFVFFQEYGGDNWPAGSLGVRVTPLRSLATDKQVFPRGCVVLVETQVPTASGGTQPFAQAMLDQDTGGAIRAAGRADIYMGIGEQAGILAGRQAAEGRMYYLLLRRDRVQSWYNQMMQQQPASPEPVARSTPSTPRG